jgi:hypothetical protein
MRTVTSVRRRERSRRPALSISSPLRSATARSIALLVFVAGWGTAAVGAITGNRWALALGFAVSGVCVLALAKVAFETRTLVTSTRSAGQDESRRLTTAIASIDDRLASTTRELDRLASTTGEIHDRLELYHAAALDASDRGLRRVVHELAELQSNQEATHEAVDQTHEASQTLARRIDRAAALIDDVRQRTGQRLTQLETAQAAIERATAANRLLLDKVGRRASRLPASTDLADLARPKVGRPKLSIAIPSYNRPELLAECLHSVERELEHTVNGTVEVCITDDASSDPDTFEVAARFVRATRIATLHLNPSNLGLERNLVQASMPCRGDYVLVLGNDDRMCDGSLATILADIDSGAADVYLYDKNRIDFDGRTIDRGDGTVPIEIPTGNAHVFPTLFDAVRRQGILSTLGFISVVVFHRRALETVDAEQYLDLTMYPLAFILVAAYFRQPLQFRNIALVEHRTPRAWQKWSETIGRHEESFMRGGATRNSRYFGTALAAAVQRLVDTTTIDVGELAELPERLFTQPSLIDWIAQCRELDPTVDDLLDAAVIGDADRLFDTIAHRAESERPSGKETM